MNFCALCSKEIELGEQAVFAGYALFTVDRERNEDSILLHAECCDTELLELLEDHLTNY
tara:strand:+ start:1071 stop:1247 length:177 start_codon:yes stop_codon:yes gene_type:complete